MIVRIFDSSLEKFIVSLEKPTISKILRVIDLLEKFGQNLGLPHSKKIAVRLFELRIRGKQEVRIFYTFHKSQIILFHGFVKNSRGLHSSPEGRLWSHDALIYYNIKTPCLL
ncbi:MAG: type II toxin-antitoxin system RelE/ParE family toxin [Promethearchaeota archaeon]